MTFKHRKPKLWVIMRLLFHPLPRPGAWEPARHLRGHHSHTVNTTSGSLTDSKRSSSSFLLPSPCPFSCPRSSINAGTYYYLLQGTHLAVLSLSCTRTWTIFAHSAVTLAQSLVRKGLRMHMGAHMCTCTGTYSGSHCFSLI